MVDELTGFSARAAGLAVPTELFLDLHGLGRPRRADAVIAFKLAREKVLDAERLDMGKLAAELGVDRTTLFRWVGNRDQLLGEIIWSVTEVNFRAALAEARGDGAALVASAMGIVVGRTTSSPAFHALMRREPERAMRLMTTRASVVQRRFVFIIQRALEAHADAAWQPILPLPDLAYLTLRITESFAYADLITGQAPEPDKAELAIAALLGVPIRR